MIEDGAVRETLLAGVSRETGRRLTSYAEILHRWNARMNLVSAPSLEHLWSRHIADCAQLASIPASPGRWIDLGSGAGLPGLIVAALFDEVAPGSTMTVVEADTRKSAFLRAAADAMKAPVDVRNVRIEDLAEDGLINEFDVVTARALAPLARLLDYAAPLVAKHAVCLFPKGVDAAAEVASASHNWRMDADRIQSQTDCRASIVVVREFARV